MSTKFSKNTTFIKNTNWAIRAYYAGNWDPNIFVPIPQYVRKLIPSEAARKNENSCKKLRPNHGNRGK